MARQNPNTLPSAANLLTAAASIRSALSAADFDGLKKGLTAAADGFEQAGAAIAILERRLRDLGEANVDLSGRSTPVVVSGDRIRGGIPVQGILPNVAGQSLDLTFADQVAHVTSMDHGTGGYLELDLDGLGVTINAHGGTIALTGTTGVIGTLALRFTSVTCANGANNDLAVSSSYALIAGPSAAFNITGFTGGANGRVLELWNPTSQTLTIRNQNAGSAVANRIYTNTGADVIVGAGGFGSFSSFIYDSTNSRWVLRSYV